MHLIMLIDNGILVVLCYCITGYAFISAAKRERSALFGCSTLQAIAV